MITRGCWLGISEEGLWNQHAPLLHCAAQSPNSISRTVLTLSVEIQIMVSQANVFSIRPYYFHTIKHVIISVFIDTIFRHLLNTVFPNDTCDVC